MSRIHEALKKAEQDRAVAQAAETAVPHAVVDDMPEPAWVDAGDADAEGEGSPIHFASPVPEKNEAPAESCPGHEAFESFRRSCSRLQWRADAHESVFHNSQYGGHAAERFRTLRSRLYQIRGSKPLRTILVTSSIPKEGKTWVVNNLGHAIIRQPDRRALMIDADLRSPRLHISLGAPSSPGLSDYLRGEADLESIVQHGNDSNLFFIPAGKTVTNPSELLSNGRMKTLIERLAPMFDWVFVDSPPCLSVADANILSNVCDGILVVLRSGKIPVEVAQKTNRELEGKNVI